jgi:hypothetical protein
MLGWRPWESPGHQLIVDELGGPLTRVLPSHNVDENRLLD